MAKETIGYITVDAGIVFIGDPCYQSDDGTEDRSDFYDWPKFCDKLSTAFKKDHYLELTHKNGSKGKGIVVPTLYGDGVYSIVALKNKDGRITKIEIDFR